MLGFFISSKCTIAIKWWFAYRAMMKSAGNLLVDFSIIAWSTTLSCYRPGGTATDADIVLDVAADAAQPKPNLVFVSSQFLNGDLGGLTGADASCNSEAIAAGLTDTFRAVLWTGTQTAAERLAGSRGWMDLAGLPVADLPSDFGTTMLHPPSKTATGAVVPDREFLATGLHGDRGAPNDCDGWTSNASTAPPGLLVVPTHSLILSDHFSINCNVPIRILCAGIGRSHVLATPQAVGRLAFVAPGIRLVGGVTQADNHCQANALAAGLSGTYAAMLAVNGNPAQTRFNQIDTPWRRVDGQLLAPSNAAFFGLSWQIPLFRDAKGIAPVDETLRFNDYVAPLGDALENCQNWTGEGIGMPRLATMSLIRSGNVAERSFLVRCDEAMPIICLQK